MGYSNCGCRPQNHSGAGSGFALLVVLFILLIIIGAGFSNRGNQGGHCC